MEESIRKKRNKPCENCRSHRRKCVMFDTTTCERCHKLQLECIFKISEKPLKTLEPYISLARRKKLFETIWMLKNDSDCIQLQLSQLQSDMRRRNDCQCIDPTQCTHNLKVLPSTPCSEWGLTISSKKDGTLHVQTSIRSLSDLSKFVAEAFAVFKFSFSADPSTPSTSGGNKVLPVTIKMLKVESAVRNLMGTLGQPTPNFNDSHCLSVAKSLIKTSQLRTQLKQSIIDEFFNCFAFVNPVLTPSYFHPLLMSNPHSLVSTSIVAMTAFSKCQHLKMTGLPFTRNQFAESCRLEAKYMLEDELFESEPSLMMCIALWALSTSSTLASKGKESRLQSSLCWNMTIQLKSTLLHKANKTIEENIHFETLRRLYYIVRYNEINFRIIYDDTKEFEGIAYHSNIGLPTPLPCESLNEDYVASVYCFRYVAQLAINNTGSTTDYDAEVAVLRLFAGVIDEIPLKTIQYLENATIHIWMNIPSNLKLGQGPFQYVHASVIQKCTSACILRVNLLYYLYWTMIQSRVMQSPQGTDLKSAAIGRIDGERALVVASMCSDTSTSIFEALSVLSPCVIKLHWLTMCLEVVESLTTSANDAVRRRAQTNLHRLVQVLKQQLDFIDSEFPTCSAPAYFIQMKQILSRHMAVNKICVV